VSINILSNLVLAPRIGLVGVVVAYMISEIVLLLGYMTIVAITRYGSEQWKTPIEI
jgi:O-antigen/teichoic acid export membrane protein